MTASKDTLLRGWAAVNLVVFATTALFVLPLIREVVWKYGDDDWEKDQARMTTSVAVLLGSSFIVSFCLHATGK